VWGANGLLSRRTGTTSVFFTFDPQGSVVQRLDANQNILSASAYDAWGNPIATSTGDPYGYCAEWGYYTDNETGLLLLTHRYYDPTQGRFLTRDPIGYSGGVNLYGYVGNGVERGIDPSGKIVKFCWRPTLYFDRQPESHWFLYDSKCGCLGYSQQGVLIEKKNNCQENKNGYTPGHGLHCRILPVTPQQEFCLCKEANNAAINGGLVGNELWLPELPWYRGGCLRPSRRYYNLEGHSCQDFTAALLGDCDPDGLKRIPKTSF
jgi:RHS repeat-associated protein